MERNREREGDGATIVIDSGVKSSASLLSLSDSIPLDPGGLRPRRRWEDYAATQRRIRRLARVREARHNDSFLASF